MDVAGSGPHAKARKVSVWRITEPSGYSDLFNEDLRIFAHAVVKHKNGIAALRYLCIFT